MSGASGKTQNLLLIGLGTEPPGQQISLWCCSAPLILKQRTGKATVSVPRILRNPNGAVSGSGQGGSVAVSGERPVSWLPGSVPALLSQAPIPSPVAVSFPHSHAD